MLDRRTLIASAAGLLAGAASCAPHKARASPPSDILVLGGTNFVGPAVVERAVARGHRVTLFNRGKTNPGLFPGLELIKGDREGSLDGLSNLAGGRRWDAVIDVWPDKPELIEPAVRMLRDRTDYYFYVSTISVYPRTDGPKVVEDSPLSTSITWYGGWKAESERILDRLAPGRNGRVRPCAILGPRDSSLAYAYWLWRLAQPGRALAPGDGKDVVQYADVRDVGVWIVDSVEARRPGPFNLTSDPTDFKTFLETTRAAVGGKAELVWVDGAFLEAQGIKYGQMPVWRNRGNAEPTVYLSGKARQTGWSPRPLIKTAADAAISFRRLFPDGVSFPYPQYGSEYGVSSQREREILAAWDARKT